MNEQLLQAYVGLIEQLLSCPQGQEEELLQVNRELVDAGLLDVMEQVAAHLEKQGSSNAQWLRGFAAQVAQALGLGTADCGTDRGGRCQTVFTRDVAVGGGEAGQFAANLSSVGTAAGSVQ